MSKSAPITLVLSAVSALLGGGPNRSVADVSGVADHVITTGRSAILRYWTAERMMHAMAVPTRTPPPMPEGPGPHPTPAHDAAPHAEHPHAARPHARPRSGHPRTDHLPAGHPVTDGPVPRRPGGDRPAIDAPAVVVPERGALRPGMRWARKGAVGATTGKVFFTVGGNDYICSAGSVTAASRDLVVTAGHCAYTAGSWAQNWIYVPGYDNGRRPYGTFTARHLFVPRDWVRKGSADYDVAMVALDPADGRHVADAVGAQDIAFNQRRGTLVYVFGYPAGGAYDGQRLVYCSGRTRPDDHHLTRDEGLRCDMTEGSSGGPWLTRFDAGTGRGVVTSVNSFKYADDPTIMYGPYFGPAVRRVYDAAQRA